MSERTRLILYFTLEVLAQVSYLVGTVHALFGDYGPATWAAATACFIKLQANWIGRP